MQRSRAPGQTPGKRSSGQGPLSLLLHYETHGTSGQAPGSRGLWVCSSSALSCSGEGGRVMDSEVGKTPSTEGQGPPSQPSCPTVGVSSPRRAQPILDEPAEFLPCLRRCHETKFLMRRVMGSVFGWPKSSKQSSPHRGPPRDRERAAPIWWRGRNVPGP